MNTKRTSVYGGRRSKVVVRVGGRSSSGDVGTKRTAYHDVEKKKDMRRVLLLELKKSTRRAKSDLKQIKRISQLAQQCDTYRRADDEKKRRMSPNLLALWRSISRSEIDGLDSLARARLEDARQLLTAMEQTR